jgi:hypothetical protein
MEHTSFCTINTTKRKQKPYLQRLVIEMEQKANNREEWASAIKDS